MPDHPFNDFLRAFAAVLDAIAWPVAAGFLGWLFQEPLGRLIDRMKEGPGGTKFEESLVTKQELTASTAEPDVPQELEPIRTASVKHWEGVIDTMPAVANAATAEQRFVAARTVAARMTVVSFYERMEGAIFGTQLGVLQYLNGRSSGAEPDAIKHLYYTLAVTKFDELRSWSFDQYMNFLLINSLVVLRDGRYHITEDGRDYLKWRISAGRGVKTFG